MVCPISSNPDSTGEAGSYAAFANTAPGLRRGILGCGEVGGKAATDAKYAHQRVFRTPIRCTASV